MEDPDIWRTDFHGLRVLAAVHETGSLVRAARRLGLTQPTLSYTLERLRGVFGAALFVRGGRGMIPTERCEAMMPEIAELLERFADLARPRAFDPATAEGRVVISCNYFERGVILPHLVRRVRMGAPGLRLAVIPARISGHLQLLRRECDLLLSPVLSDRSGLMTRHLLSDRYVCLLRRGDPRARGLDARAYAKAQHVAVEYATGWQPFYRPALRAMGIEVEPAVEVPSYGAVRRLLEEGDFVMTVPSLLVPEFGPGCEAVAAPFEAGFDLRLYWSARAHDAPLNAWLRRQVIEATADALRGRGGR